MNQKTFKDRLKARFPFLADLAFRRSQDGLIRSIRYDLRGSGHSISIHRSAVLKNVTFQVGGNAHTIEIGAQCILQNVTFFLRGSSHKIVLGHSVRFSRAGVLWMEDTRNEISIGAGATFEDAHLAATGNGKKIVIGSDCMFANDIDVRTGDSHAIVNLEGQKQNQESDVTIGDHVWIAAHCSILKGAFISSNSVVATRSTVTTQFTQANALIGGSPARIIKEGISWTRERFPKG